MLNGQGAVHLAGKFSADAAGELFNEDVGFAGVQGGAGKEEQAVAVVGGLVKALAEAQAQTLGGPPAVQQVEPVSAGPAAGSQPEKDVLKAEAGHEKDWAYYADPTQGGEGHEEQAVADVGGVAEALEAAQAQTLGDPPRCSRWGRRAPGQQRAVSPKRTSCCQAAARRRLSRSR